MEGGDVKLYFFSSHAQMARASDMKYYAVKGRTGYFTFLVGLARGLHALLVPRLRLAGIQTRKIGYVGPADADADAGEMRGCTKMTRFPQLTVRDWIRSGPNNSFTVCGSRESRTRSSPPLLRGRNASLKDWDTRETIESARALRVRCRKLR